MSSILKALRKVESDKALIGEGNVDIAHDIIKHRYDDVPTTTSTRMMLWIGGIILIVLLVGGWFFHFEIQLKDSPDRRPAASGQRPAKQSPKAETGQIKTFGLPGMEGEPGNRTKTAPVCFQSPSPLIWLCRELLTTLILKPGWPLSMIFRSWWQPRSKGLKFLISKGIAFGSGIRESFSINTPATRKMRRRRI